MLAIIKATTQANTHVHGLCIYVWYVYNEIGNKTERNATRTTINNENIYIVKLKSRKTVRTRGGAGHGGGGAWWVRNETE